MGGLLDVAEDVCVYDYVFLCGEAICDNANQQDHMSRVPHVGGVLWLITVSALRKRRAVRSRQMDKDIIIFMAFLEVSSSADDA